MNKIVYIEDYEPVVRKTSLSDHLAHLDWKLEEISKWTILSAFALAAVVSLFV